MKPPKKKKNSHTQSGDAEGFKIKIFELLPHFEVWVAILQTTARPRFFVTDGITTCRQAKQQQERTTLLC
jgi:hypothetical protein